MRAKDFLSDRVTIEDRNALHDGLVRIDRVAGIAARLGEDALVSRFDEAADVSGVENINQWWTGKLDVALLRVALAHGLGDTGMHWGRIFLNKTLPFHAAVTSFHVARIRASAVTNLDAASKKSEAARITAMDQAESVYRQLMSSPDAPKTFSKMWPNVSIPTKQLLGRFKFVVAVCSAPTLVAGSERAKIFNGKAWRGARGGPVAVAADRIVRGKPVTSGTQMKFASNGKMEGKGKGPKKTKAATPKGKARK